MSRGTQYNAQELRKYGGKTILIFSGTVSGSGNNRTNTSYPILRVMQFKEATFFLNVTELVGTPGTLDVLVETKHPAGDYYFTLATFNTATIPRVNSKDVTSNLGENLAISWTLVTFTSATFSVYGVFKIM